MEKKLIIFGVSGVLLDDKMGGIKDVLVILGKGKEAKEIDKEYQKRKYIGPWGLKELAKLYKGFSENELRKVAFEYCQENLKSGVKEVLIELKKRGHLLGVLSSNPQFFTDGLSEILPLDFSEGTQLEFKRGLATGRIKRRIDRYVKIRILKEKIKTLGFKKDQVIVISDTLSLTDFPMVKEAGFFVGFDPKKEKIREVADALVVQRDLGEVFRL